MDKMQEPIKEIKINNKTISLPISIEVDEELSGNIENGDREGTLVCIIKHLCDYIEASQKPKKSGKQKLSDKN